MRKFSAKRTNWTSSSRKTANVGKKIKRSLFLIFLLFVLLWAGLVFIRSDLFSLKKIEITGNTRLSEADIMESMRVQPGDNILQMSIQLLEERLLANPRVESVQITRNLPDTLHVELQERKILALIPFQEFFLEVGDNGQILGSTTQTLDAALPLLTGITPVTGAVGEYILDLQLLEKVKEICKALDEEKLMVSEINVANENNLIVVTLDGLAVWFGEKDFAKKTRILAQIMGQLDVREKEGYLDLRVATAPAFHITEN
ncbi:MAG: FtsQ-type POTRA domain-containing protein [Firmicutes bacterium]|nr:FtsQ-type POTRA domain-containing protein [Bacillota bacterium]